MIGIILMSMPAFAKLNIILPDSGYVIPTQAIELATQKDMDSIMSTHQMVAERKFVMQLQEGKPYHSDNLAFFSILSLVLFFGGVKYFNLRYFQNFWRVFRSPSLGTIQLKENIDRSVVPNFIMNIFFVLVVGVYVYFLVNILFPQRSQYIPASILLPVLIAAVALVYVIKYLVIRFSGWVFKIQGITDNYIFNVFLINKVIAIVLLPFLLFIAFAEPFIANIAALLSLVVVVLLLINRYTRSWQHFGSFFQYSRFHFFTYLCASEILPMAVLMKLLVSEIL